MFNKILKKYQINQFILNKWLKNTKNNCFKNLKKRKFPTNKDEDWINTNVNDFFKENFKLYPDNIEIDYSNLERYFFNNLTSYRIVFINNTFNSILSNIKNEINISTLSNIFSQKKYEKFITSYYNSSPNYFESFFLLNTLFSNEGTFIKVKKNVKLSQPIEIINFSIDNNYGCIIHPRNFIFLEEGSEVQIIEKNYNIGKTANLINSVCEIFLKKNAKINFYKIQNDTLNTNLIDYTSIMQNKNSIANVYTFSIGGNLTRNNLNFYQQGENSNSILRGITLINKKQFVDHHTLVDHMFKNGKSNQVYRSIFNDFSKGVFNGKIIVNKKAQKTNAFQKNDNLILSNNSCLNTKPQLEIYADDVKCSHGCTIGQIEKEIVFYLQSRGIPKKECKYLLAFIFITNILDVSIPNNIKKEIKKLIINKLNIKII